MNEANIALVGKISIVKKGQNEVCLGRNLLKTKFFL